MSIALGQLERDADIRANLAVISRFAAGAACSDATLVALPSSPPAGRNRWTRRSPGSKRAELRQSLSLITSIASDLKGIRMKRLMDSNNGRIAALHVPFMQVGVYLANELIDRAPLTTRHALAPSSIQSSTKVVTLLL